MDKNKSRTDMLAAGRKKLQQYRKKKDGKGSKSLGKTGKSEQNMDAVKSSEMEPTVPEGLRSVLDDATDELVNSSASHSRENSDISDVIPMTSESSSMPVFSEAEKIQTAMGTTDEFPSEVEGVNEAALSLSVDNEVQNKAGSSSSETWEMVNSEGKSQYVSMTAPADFSAPPDLTNDVDDVIEMDRGQEAYQDAECSGLKQIDNSVVALDGDTSLSILGPDVSSDADVGASDSKFFKAELTSKPHDVSISESAIAGTEEVRKTHGQSDSNPSIVSCDPGNYHGGRVQEDTLEKFDDIKDSSASSLAGKMISWADGSMVSVSQLAGVVRGLGEEEFSVLLLGRESATKHTDALETLTEQLYLTNFAKDMFHLLLTEQLEIQKEFDSQSRRFVDEISMASASLDEARGKNESLTDELGRCVTELQVAVSEREDFQKKFHVMKAEFEEISTRSDKLQIELQTSLEELKNASTELADCKALVATLQLENENLTANLNSVLKERKKFEKENHKLAKDLVECKASLELLQVDNTNSAGSLASMTEERMKLEEEKNSYIHENEKLLAELAECKGFAESLQVENANLKDILTSVTEGRRKIEEEKEHLTHETEKLSSELTGCTCMVETLKTEISNLNESLALITEDRKKLAQENDCSLTNIEKLSTELAACKSLTADKQLECNQAVNNLKEATLHVEQLTEENAFLIRSMDVYNKANIREFEMKISSQSVESRALFHDQESVTDDCSNEVLGKRGNLNLFPVLENSTSDGHAELKLDVYDDSFGFVALKAHLEQAAKVVQKLEEAIEEVHSHWASLSRSSSKMVAPAVSKLIQAFESKTHTDDDEGEDADQSTENQSHTVDPFMLLKEETGNLMAMLKELVVDADNASDLLKGERNDKMLAEEAKIELVVLYEVIRQHLYDVEAKKGELLLLYEAVRQQDVIVKAENTELGNKLSAHQSRISDLEGQLNELHQNSNETISSMNIQMEILHKEVSDRASILEQEWNSIVAGLANTVEKLDAHIGTVSSSGDLFGTQNDLDIGSHVAASFEAATRMIDDLREKLDAAHTDHKVTCSSYDELNQKFNDLHGHDELATGVLHKIYTSLRELVNDSSGFIVESEKLQDPLHSDACDTLMDQLRKLLDDRLSLKSLNNQLNSELIDKAKHIKELNRRCTGADAILKLVEHVEGVVGLEGIEINMEEPALLLESLTYFLIQRYKEANDMVILSRKELGSREIKLNELQSHVDHLVSMFVHSENDNIIFQGSLRSAIDDVAAVQVEILGKVTELEQSEQRVSSLREKLSIAVAKGKGLIVQRDSLKQSLAEKSAELERCLQELQLKDARLIEVETKLKTYSEGGERVEALESELSYIRNSATALRESFLLKDSVLQRIEEVLEDLELPEHFHARNIIEKIDWLARSVTGNSLPPTDWDQKGSAGGGSNPDNTSFPVMDASKENMPPGSNLDDELRRKYDDLQSKFYGLAEQNEMLEQSLMERNNLVQRWEEILDKINMPSQLRSMEPEDRIEWLGGALSEAVHRCDSLQQRIDNFETFCGSLSAELEESQRRSSVLEASLQSVTGEKEHLSTSLEILTRANDEVSEKADFYEVQNYGLQNEVTELQEKLEVTREFEDRIHHFDSEIRRLQNLLLDVLQDSDAEEEQASDNTGIKSLEQLLRKLLENFSNHKSSATLEETIIADSADAKEHEEVSGLKKELEEALGNLTLVREERDAYVENNQSLVHEVEKLDIKRSELQELLNQEEQKSASVREKLNLAVRKGKSLVQQRDGMRQTIDELTTEVAHLKSEIEGMESKNLILQSHLAETERDLQGKERTLSLICSALGEIDIGFEFEHNVVEPVEKILQIGKVCRDLQVAAASSENESNKSRRAAELLLAELNEVQERNDGLQEELVELAKERDSAESAKREALSHLEKLNAVHSEERDNQFAEFEALKSYVHQLRNGFFDFSNLLDDALFKDLEFVHNLKATIKSILKSTDAADVVSLRFGGSTAGITSTSSRSEEEFLSPNSLSESRLQEQFNNYLPSEICNFVGRHLVEVTTEIGSLKEKLYKHSSSLPEEANFLSELVGTIHTELSSRKHFYESVKGDISRFKSMEKEKNMEITVIRRNISLLYEACKNSVAEVKNWKAQLVGKGFDSESRISIDGGNLFNGQTISDSEGFVKTMADRLLSAVKEIVSIQSEILEANQMELKTRISSLQTALQEKDIEKDRICVELVNQIKETESTGMTYFQELRSAKDQIHNLEQQVELMEEERSRLQQRVQEIQDREATSIDLQERVRSLTDVIGAKEQEIEALMQALDEEESQMEHLKNKIADLESRLRERTLDIENAEASRGKALKKLSITVSKFDELHHFSESLLSEVEKLQSQLHERDTDISFLRQEVTRSTNDALVASQMSSKRDSDEIYDLISWLGSVISQVQTPDVHSGHNYKEMLQKQIMAILSELEELRVGMQGRDTLLRLERSRVEELMRQGESLEKALREKESQLTILQGVENSGQGTNMTSEIMEVEPVANKWAVPGPSIAPQVRSLRKSNNDQVAISVDMDSSSGHELENEDDDKAHGFKSLTTSKVVPKFTRPVTDLVDGLWVSCDRALMRQPALRLGVIMYWVILHALLATFAI